MKHYCTKSGLVLKARTGSHFVIERGSYGLQNEYNAVFFHSREAFDEYLEESLHASEYVRLDTSIVPTSHYNNYIKYYN